MGSRTHTHTQKLIDMGVNHLIVFCFAQVHGDVEIGIIDEDSTVVPVVITEEPNSVLHVVATAGDSDRHLKCATMIHAKASHLLMTQNSKGDTPLHCAARAKKTKMVAHLIELAKGIHGVDYNKATDLVRMRNKRGETALHEAIRFHSKDMVQELMNTDEELAQVNAEDGTSPLYLASLLGHVESVSLILEKGKDPSYSGLRQQNALHAAALHNYKG